MTHGWGKKSGDFFILKQDDLILVKITINLNLVAKRLEQLF